MKENRQQLRRQRRLAKVIQSVLYGCCLIGHTHNISSKFPPFGQLDNAVQVQDQTTSQSSNTTSDPPIQSYQFQEAPPPTDIQYDDGGDISQSTFQNNSEWSGQVFYTDLDGEIKVINDIESSYTISQIKYEIWSTSGIPPTQLMIKYGGRILDSTRSLSSYHIEEGSCFQLQLRLRGGSGAAEDDYEAAMEDTADINNNEEAATIANSIDPNGLEHNLEPVVGTADNDGEGIAASSSMTSGSDNVIGTIDKIETICNKQFPPGKRFPTSEALKSELTALGQKWGFGISVSGRQLKCTRGGQPRKPKANDGQNTTKKRARVTSLKCGCEFVCNWGYVIPTFPHPDNAHGSTDKAIYRTTPELQEVIIKPTSKYRHSNSCEPCYEQYQFQARRTGKLFIKESERMADLLSLLQLGKWRMDNETLRGHLSLVNPSQTHVTADELRNFRMWARKEVVSGKRTVLTEQDLKDMFADHIAKPNSSVAIEEAEELYRNLLQATMENSGNTWKVEQYLNILKKNDRCFDYRIMRDNMSGAATMVLWQTGTMRGDFELYGCALHLDFMKRQLNSYEWPYISIVAMDSNGSPRVVAEGIACTERNEAYVAAVRALLAMSPGRTNENVLAVFADGALNENILSPANMNLPNAKFIWDSFHLSHDIWPKNFGKAWTETLSTLMNNMLYANSKEEFDTALSTIEETYTGNSNILNKVHKIAEKKQCYAKYMLLTYEGTCGKTSNNPAEQNHSSIIAHLGGALYEDPAFEIKALLGRQAEHEKKRNQERSRHYFSIPTEIMKSSEIQNTPALKAAKQTLEADSFDLWQTEFNNSSCYTCVVDPTTGSRTFTHFQHPNSPRVLCKDQRCSCSTRVQHLTQCRHEIAEQVQGQEFRLDLIDRRHHFYHKLHTKVERGSNINGTICPTRILPTLSSNPNTNTMNDNDDDLEDNNTIDVPLAAMSSPVAMKTQRYNTKKKTKVTYNEITKVTNEFASLAISRGHETATQALGLAIQFTDMLRTGGQLMRGTTDEIILNYQQTFSGTATSSVSFALDSETLAKTPYKPPPKPGSRQPESRLAGKTMEAIKAKRGDNRCTFCKNTKEQGCGSISNCKKKGEFGIHLKKVRGGVDEVSLLLSYIKSCRNGGAEYLAPWSGSRSALQEGVPTDARHIVVHGFYSLRSESGPIIVVGDIQFLVEGGIEVDAYSHLPITLDELEKILYQDFRAQGKYVFVNNSLYSVLQA